MTESTVLWKTVRKTGSILRFEIAGKSGFWLNLYAPDGNRISGVSIALRDMPALVCVMVQLIGKRVGMRDEALAQDDSGLVQGKGCEC